MLDINDMGMFAFDYDGGGASRSEQDEIAMRNRQRSAVVQFEVEGLKRCLIHRIPYIDWFHLAWNLAWGIGFGKRRIIKPALATRCHSLTPRGTTPAATNNSPTQSRTLCRSRKKITAKMATRMTLNLSTGATLDAGPNFKARK